MKRGSQPTWTSLCESALRSRDDFASVAMLMQDTGGSINQVLAALHCLRHYRAADVIVNPDGKGWWYALPQEQDTRTRLVPERVPESQPRRKRKSRQPRPLKGDEI